MCLLVACATATPMHERPPRPSDPAPREAGTAAIAIEPEPACEPLPPPPEPLDPLREFTDEEWRRIRRAQRYVHHAARRHTLSPSLINGMIWVESKFESRARGRRGPRGVLQLMPRTGRAMARKLRRKYMPYSIDFNIAAGTEYLMVMLEQFDGDLELALAAYNAGPALVVDWRRAECPTPKPRQPYVAHVQRAARTFCQRLPSRHEPEAGVFTCTPPDEDDEGANEDANEDASEDADIASAEPRRPPATPE